MEEVIEQPEDLSAADVILEESDDVTHTLYDVMSRTATFIASYLIYLLIMCIVLDFWDKLKEPTKQFLRTKIEKYVDQRTLAAYFQQMTESLDKQPPAEGSKSLNQQAVSDKDGSELKPGENDRFVAGDLQSEVPPENDTDDAIEEVVYTEEEVTQEAPDSGTPDDVKLIDFGEDELVSFDGEQEDVPTESGEDNLDFSGREESPLTPQDVEMFLQDTVSKNQESPNTGDNQLIDFEFEDGHADAGEDSLMSIEQDNVDVTEVEENLFTHHDEDILVQETVVKTQETAIPEDDQVKSSFDDQVDETENEPVKVEEGSPMDMGGDTNQIEENEDNKDVIEDENLQVEGEQESLLTSNDVEAFVQDTINKAQESVRAEVDQLINFDDDRLKGEDESLISVGGQGVEMFVQDTIDKAVQQFQSEEETRTF